MFNLPFYSIAHLPSLDFQVSLFHILTEQICSLENWSTYKTELIFSQSLSHFASSSSPRKLEYQNMNIVWSIKRIYKSKTLQFMILGESQMLRDWIIQNISILIISYSKLLNSMLKLISQLATSQILHFFLILSQKLEFVYISLDFVCLLLMTTCKRVNWNVSLVFFNFSSSHMFSFHHFPSFPNSLKP